MVGTWRRPHLGKIGPRSLIYYKIFAMWLGVVRSRQVRSPLSPPLFYHHLTSTPDWSDRDSPLDDGWRGGGGAAAAAGAGAGAACVAWRGSECRRPECGLAGRRARSVSDRTWPEMEAARLVLVLPLVLLGACWLTGARAAPRDMGHGGPVAVRRLAQVRSPNSSDKHLSRRALILDALGVIQFYRVKCDEVAIF